MHKYPSWVLKEIDSEIDDVIITDSNADLLLSGTPKTGGGRVRSIPRSSQGLRSRRTSFVSEKVRRASQLSKMRRSSLMSTGTPGSPTKDSRLRHRQSSEILKQKIVAIDEDTKEKSVPVEKRDSNEISKSKFVGNIKRQSVKTKKKRSNRVASKAVKLMGVSKSFVAAANKRDKTGKLLRLATSMSSRGAILGSLRGILRRATWRTCNVSLLPGILTFEDFSVDGSRLSSESDEISLTEINSMEMNTVPAEPCEYYTIKITIQNGDSYTFRSNDRVDIRHWEQAIVMARALSEGILLPALGYEESTSRNSTPDIRRSSSVESHEIPIRAKVYDNQKMKKRKSQVHRQNTAETAPKRIIAMTPSTGSPVHTTQKVPGEDEEKEKSKTTKKLRRSTTPGVPSQWNRPCEFSVPLEYQAKSQVFPYEHKIPTVLIGLADLIVKHHGMETEGIFRITPNRSNARDVRERICRGELDPQCEDPHIFAHIMKQYFRDLPTNLMGKLVSTASLNTIEREMNADPFTREESNISNVLRKSIQSEHLAVLLWLLDFLALVASFEHKNRMSAKALSVVMAPNMISMDDFSMTDPLRTLEENKRVMNVLDKLISWRLSRQLRSKKLLSNMTFGELKSHLRLNAGLSEALCKKVFTQKMTGKTLASAIVNYERFGVFPAKFADQFTSKEENEFMRAIDLDRKQKWIVFRMRVNSRGRMDAVV